MEKISRIIPPSRRVTTVDTSSSQPVRPGAPEYGRPSPRLNVEDRVSLSSLATERPMTNDNVTYKNPKEMQRAKVVDELAEKFFSAPRELARENGDRPLSEEFTQAVQKPEQLEAKKRDIA